MRAQAMWKEKAKIGQDDIADVLNRTFEKEIADMGITIKRQQDVPHILNSWFDEPVMPLTMPDVMKFQANSTEGKIQGEYYHKTRTVTCRVGVENNSPRTITGRVENDKVVFGK